MVRSLLLVGVAVLLFAPVSRAALMFEASLDGLQEVPPNASPAFGSMDGTLTGGPGSYVFSFTTSYFNLLGNSTTETIQQGAVGVSGSVVHAFNLTPNTSDTFSDTWSFSDGTFPLTDAAANALMSGGDYINIRSQVFPSGEIRGQIVSAVPEPSSILLLGAPTLALLRRSRRAKAR